MEKLELRIQRCEEDIKELKKYRDECSDSNNKTKTELAKLYNVSKTNIAFIKQKKQWKWLTDTLD